MTQINLLESLAEYIRNSTKDIILPVKADEEEEVAERACNVYPLTLPDKEAATGNIPYILLQLVSGKDGLEERLCSVRLVIAIYSENLTDGNSHLLSLITRIETALLKDRIVDERYTLEDPIEYIVYTDNATPFFMGEMMTTFKLPPVYPVYQNDWKGDAWSND